MTHEESMIVAGLLNGEAMESQMEMEDGSPVWVVAVSWKDGDIERGCEHWTVPPDLQAAVAERLAKK